MLKIGYEGLISIPVDGVSIEAYCYIPRDPVGMVIFAHGSGSSRHSPRNTYIASVLNKAHIGTLLVDLLTEEEDDIYDTRFDIHFLTDRLIKIIEWYWSQVEVENLPIGLFGASTGAAAALKAAAILSDDIQAVVSRGGRPDLALNELYRVKASTLLIVGAKDEPVLKWNREALRSLCCTKQLAVVPGATHLFEEPGTLEIVATLATSWYKTHFSPVLLQKAATVW